MGDLHGVVPIYHPLVLRGWLVFDCYVDNGFSGKKDSRPQLNRIERRMSCEGAYPRAKAKSKRNTKDDWSRDLRAAQS
jgi:hypothetical protein